jgi:hypothetical protein
MALAAERPKTSRASDVADALLSGTTGEARASCFIPRRSLLSGHGRLKRLAENWLRSTLEEARRGTLPGMVRTGATFADAAAEYLRHIGRGSGPERPRRSRTTGRSSVCTSSPRSATQRWRPSR